MSRKPQVYFANADLGVVDKKYEGFSNLKGKHDKQQKLIARK